MPARRGARAYGSPRMQGPTRRSAPFSGYTQLGLLNDVETDAFVIRRAQELCTPIIRSRIALKTGVHQMNPELILAAGLQTQLVIRNSTGNGISTMPTDVPGALADIGTALLRTASQRVVVENEVDNTTSFWHTGSNTLAQDQADYQTWLTAICDYVHANFPGVLVSDSGFTSSFVNYAAFKEIKDRLGLPAAQAFRDLTWQSFQLSHENDGTPEAKWTEMQGWLAAINASGIDRVNQHFYDDDNRPLGLRAKSEWLSLQTGKPCWVNEAGMRSIDPAVMTAMLVEAVEIEQLDMFVWYSVDTVQGTESLWEPGIEYLRPIGDALEDFQKSNAACPGPWLRADVASYTGVAVTSASAGRRISGAGARIGVAVVSATADVIPGTPLVEGSAALVGVAASTQTANRRLAATAAPIGVCALSAPGKAIAGGVTARVGVAVTSASARTVLAASTSLIGVATTEAETGTFMPATSDLVGVARVSASANARPTKGSASCVGVAVVFATGANANEIEIGGLRPVFVVPPRRGARQIFATARVFCAAYVSAIPDVDHTRNEDDELVLALLL